MILPSVTDYPATPEWFSFPHIAIFMVPVNKRRQQHHYQTLTASVTHVLNQGVTYVLTHAPYPNSYLLTTISYLPTFPPLTFLLFTAPRPSIDGTCRPASRAALTGLLTVVFRGSSQSLGSRPLGPRLCAPTSKAPFVTLPSDLVDRTCQSQPLRIHCIHV